MIVLWYVALVLVTALVAHILRRHSQEQLNDLSQSLVEFRIVVVDTATPALLKVARAADHLAMGLRERDR